MAYTKQTWDDYPSEATLITAAALDHIEDGIEAAHTEKAALAGATFTGNIAAPNMTGVLSLAVGAAVPSGTPVGTVIVRY